MFLGIDSYPRNVNNIGGDEDEDDDEMLEELLDHLGARNLFTEWVFLCRISVTETGFVFHVLNLNTYK